MITEGGRSRVRLALLADTVCTGAVKRPDHLEQTPCYNDKPRRCITPGTMDRSVA
jgi:hypothetical protein